MLTKDEAANLDFLIKDELEAIEGYNKEMAKTTNPQLIALFKHIIEEEQEHIEELNNAKEGKFEEHPTKFQDNMNKALRTCDYGDSHHIETYKGWNISWDEGTGHVNVSRKGEKFEAPNVKEAKNRIDEKETNKLSKKYTFRAMRETNGIPDYREITVESDSKENARNEAKRMLYKGERLI